MGCCCSVNPAAIAVPIPPPPQLERPASVAEVHSEIMSTVPSSTYLYMLGVTNAKRQLLLRFDPETLHCSELKLPLGCEVPLLLFKIYNYSSMVAVGPDRFLVCGGITANMQSITSKCFLLEPLAGRLEGLPPMNHSRYTATTLFHDEHVYVFGGRRVGPDETAIMCQCERFNLLESRWEQLPPMKVKRCTGFALSWQNKLYVFGGYTAEFHRERAIEIFDPTRLLWSLYQFELYQGIECGAIATTRDNQFVVFGGNMEFGPVATVYAINLQEGTIHTRPKMSEPRSLQKSLVRNDKVYMIGGGQRDNLEIYNMRKQEWKQVDTHIEDFIRLEELDFFAYGQMPCSVGYSPSRPREASAEYNDEIVYLFGSEAEPFILELNISVPYAVSHPVPLEMKCFSHQGGVAVPEGGFVLAGGITEDFNKPVKHSYFFDGRNRKAKALPDMNRVRYAFSAVYCSGYIYVLGGRNETDHEEGLMNQSERLNLSTWKWEEIAPLPMKVASCCAFTYKDRIYVTGGYQPSQNRSNSVYMFDPQQPSWKGLKFSMQFGVEASALLWQSPTELLFFGGRVYSGDIDGVWKMTITKESPNGTIEEAVIFQTGQLSQAKSLHKVYHPRHQDFVMVLGGTKQPTSFYNIRSNAMQRSDLLSNLFSTFEPQTSRLQDPSMKKYLLLS